MPKKKKYCTVNHCGRSCVGQGMCRMHYNRWYKYGDPNMIKKLYRHKNPICLVTGCSLPTWAKGFCGNHYALFRRHGEPVRKKVFQFSYLKDGYRYVYVSHQHYEPEHRLVMEKFLGRKLLPKENIHHIDGDTLNNSPSNLQIVTRAEHMKIHRLNMPNQHWPHKRTK